jgi:hypothetical protein
MAWQAEMADADTAISSTFLWAWTQQMANPTARTRYFDFIDFDYPNKPCYPCNPRRLNQYLVHSGAGGGTIWTAFSTHGNGQSSMGTDFIELYVGATYRLEYRSTTPRLERAGGISGGAIGLAVQVSLVSATVRVG